MGGGGGLISSIFGGGASSPSTPDYKPVPGRESEAEAEAKTVRDEEKRKLKARAGMSGTILTTPLGVNNATESGGILGGNKKL